MMQTVGTKAHELAKAQREISVAEFFEKNRHLLGFDNPRKALLTTVKEAVDNALDACEEAEILPEISVEIIDMQDNRFRIIIEDNGPGILKAQIPNIFAKLLYGSKFHALRATRGQQGIGISAAGLYAQLTTGRPVKITSKISPTHPAHYYELHINTSNNKPEIVKDEELQWKHPQGTRIEMDLEASYQKGPQSVDEYLKQTAIVNPHATIIYTNPKAEQYIFARASQTIPPKPKEIKPHPYGIELGILIKMLKGTDAKTLQQFLTTEFSRVSPAVAKEICDKAHLKPNADPQEVGRTHADAIMKAIKNTKIIAPPTDCVVPIGNDLLVKGLKKEVQAEFYCSVSRSPVVYRGNPFIIECAMAYGGTLTADSSVRVLRFANRVPLLYQHGACSMTTAITETNWRSYGLSQSSGALPQGPLLILVHMSSVWVPFTSESKEAIAHYPEIIKEMKLCLQECGRQLGRYVNKKRRIGDELKKRGYIEKYIPHLASALQKLLQFSDDDEKKIVENLKVILEKKRGALEDFSFDPSKNEEYDEDFARIGAEEDAENTEDAGDADDTVTTDDVDDASNAGESQSRKRRTGSDD